MVKNYTQKHNFNLFCRLSKNVKKISILCTLILYSIGLFSFCLYRWTGYLIGLFMTSHNTSIMDEGQKDRAFICDHSKTAVITCCLSLIMKLICVNTLGLLANILYVDCDDPVSRAPSLWVCIGAVPKTGS